MRQWTWANPSTGQWGLSWLANEWMWVLIGVHLTPDIYFTDYIPAPLTTEPRYTKVGFWGNTIDNVEHIWI